MLKKIINNVEQVIVGKREAIELVVTALISNGHILLEDVPGVGKTRLIAAVARSIDGSFKRIQFTADVLPSDITGFSVYNQKTGDFEFKKGAIMSQFVLADEINRTSPKTQAALLEAMEERQISVDGVTYKMPQPFMVMATQNPVDQEGTYALPEAQVDRFMMKIKITYPRKEEEKVILDRMMDNSEIPLNCVVSKEKIAQINSLINEIYIGDRVKNYIIDIIDATRHPENYGLKINNLINYPASPRASIFLARAAKGFALLNGRGYVTADDIKNVSMMVLRHRILLSYEAEAEGISSEDVITKIFNSVVVP